MSSNNAKYIKRKARLHAQGLTSNGRPWNPRKRHSLLEALASSADRFWSKVEKTGQCWLWQAGLSRNGYGKFKLTYDGCSHTVPSHRIAYMLESGVIEPGMLVCHKCDNPKCVNPAHLWLGSSYDNMQDKVLKGRQARGDALSKAIVGKVINCPRGSRCWSAVLTDDDVVNIRCLALGGSAQNDIAATYGVSKQTICNIVHRKSWRHVP
jgi:hypothetical protein